MTPASNEKNIKPHSLESVASNLSLFFPHLDNHFMCPVCLRIFNITSDRGGISKAHLIPEAAGGKATTFLCRKCNSDAGSKQDKWFGELIRLYKGNLSVFDSKFKSPNFRIQQEKFNGSWEMDEHGNLEFYVHVDRNSPESVKQLKERFKVPLAITTVAVPIPLDRNKRYVDIGYLTMAYLYYFVFFGYSWVVQRHLDLVRKQILLPDETIIEQRGFIKFISDDLGFDPPVFAAATVGKIVCPALLYQNTLITFPPPRSGEHYSRLAGFRQGNAHLKFIPLNTHFLHSLISMSYSEKALILPDILQSLIDVGKPHEHILLQDSTVEPIVFRPVSEEKARRLRHSGRGIRKIQIATHAHQDQGLP